MTRWTQRPEYKPQPSQNAQGELDEVWRRYQQRVFSLHPMTTWSEHPDEPQSLRELTIRHSSPPIFNRRCSDERPSFSSRLAGALLPICLTLMVLSLAGSAVLLWLAR